MKSSDIYCKKCKGVGDLNALHGITDAPFLPCTRCRGSFVHNNHLILAVELKYYCQLNKLNYDEYKAARDSVDINGSCELR